MEKQEESVEGKGQASKDHPADQETVAALIMDNLQLEEIKRKNKKNKSRCHHSTQTPNQRSVRALLSDNARVINALCTLTDPTSNCRTISPMPAPVTNTVVAQPANQRRA